MVEELLEIEIGIFDLPVYGDTKIKIDEVTAFQGQSDEKITCYSCASPLNLTSPVRKKGYISCRYCQTTTLLYAKNSDKLLLGQSNLQQIKYEVAYTKGRAGVFHKENKQVTLALMGNQIVKNLLNPAVKGEAVIRIGIQEISVPIDMDLKDLKSIPSPSKVICSI